MIGQNFSSIFNLYDTVTQTLLSLQRKMKRHVYNVLPGSIRTSKRIFENILEVDNSGKTDTKRNIKSKISDSFLSNFLANKQHRISGFYNLTNDNPV